MYCTNCGEKTGEEAKFCATCGKKLEEGRQGVESMMIAGPAQEKSRKIESIQETSERTSPDFETVKPLPNAKSTHPWRRFLARNVDMFLVGLPTFLVFMFALSMMFPSHAAIVLQSVENPIVAGLVTYVLWMPIEATLLAVTGTTPAKWLFGISVGTHEGGRLSYRDAFMRTGLVLVQGEAAGIPFIAFFTRLFAYRRLVSTGTTLWDTDTGALVHHQKWGPGRAIACTLAVICVLIVLRIVYSL